MRVKALLTVLTAAALAVTGAAIPTAAAGAGENPRPCADAPAAPVRTGAVFNDPAAGDPTAIVRQICGLVKQAPSGSRIRIAHFVISGEAGADFAAELVRAHERGVDVQVVLDGWQVTNPAVGALRDVLGTDETRRSWLHVCTGLSPEGNTAACIGTKGQHNKFYLFSRTGGQSDVVVQSSANFTDLNSTTYWNNALTLVGNSKLYRAYDSYFEDLAAERRTDDYARVTGTGMRGGSVTSYFHPFATQDPVAAFLDEAGCRTATTIRIGMSEWDTYRIGLAERLVELAGDGCDVRIVHGLIDDEVRRLLESHPNIALRALDDAAVLPGRIHSKYLLLEGEYDGEPGSRWVLTGSPNFNQTSLRRNDEAMLKTNLGTVYAQYEDNFRTMWAAAG
ncbi:phospholipase D-like domain-containing protein [Prauserella endophytica]|uniref:phospholipase D n=1 Tax=Prauserella endophytica TaxID=1592324 RepID=A0ABY2RYN0_9PSEU|nr:phospholipase D-like domain-containing protein [Prauserella endophytica]TKG65796.1 phosphatidylserine/phosphatidylglycerophosphate/cardiolipin synthase family protein [Prauserella endophytica]